MSCFIKCFSETLDETQRFRQVLGVVRIRLEQTHHGDLDRCCQTPHRLVFKAPFVRCKDPRQRVQDLCSISSILWFRTCLQCRSQQIEQMKQIETVNQKSTLNEFKTLQSLHCSVSIEVQPLQPLQPRLVTVEM